MTNEPNRDDVRELLGAYALDALDLDERAQVDELLLIDASARAELHELQQGAAWLGHASLRPPTGAWDAISAEIVRDLGADASTLTAIEPAPTPAPTPAPVTPIRRTARPVTRWLVAAAAVVVLAVGATGVMVVTDGSNGSESVTTRYAAAQRDPDARATILRAPDGGSPVPVVVLPDRTGYLDAASLPAPRAGRDLQLWSITPDGPVSSGVLRGDRSVHEFRVASVTRSLAVTDEPRGGSDQPTGVPLVSGDLTSA